MLHTHVGHDGIYITSPLLCIALCHILTLKVGFRQTIIRGSQLLHNGHPVMLRGVNRHEFDPVTGKAIKDEDMLQDVVAMKRAGFNAVRCSHYPNHERW